MTEVAARSVKPFTKAEAIAYLLGIHCQSCGALQSGPGQPCDSCGTIPPVTGPQAEEALSTAAAVSAVQGRVLEAEAEALFRQAVEKWQDAAQVVLVAEMQDARDAARTALDEHRAAHRKLTGVARRAQAAEDAGAARLAPEAEAVSALAAELELAEKMRHGVKAVARAKAAHRDALEALQPFQADLASAAAKRQAAEDDVTRSGQRGDQLAKALADAESGLSDPGPAPLGVTAILHAPYLLAEEGRLDDGGIQLAGAVGQVLCDRAGITDEVTAQARRELLEEFEGLVRGGPVQIGKDEHGRLTATASRHRRPWSEPPAAVPPGGVVTPPPPTPLTGGRPS